MWLFTTTGFYSVVEDYKDPTILQIRARVKKDLVTLKNVYLPEMSKIKFSVGTDYPFRGYVSKEKFAEVMPKIVMDINYTNFKDTVEKVQGKERSSIYLTVWSTMLRLETNLRKKRLNSFAKAIRGPDVDWRDYWRGRDAKVG